MALKPLLSLCGLLVKQTAAGWSSTDYYSTSSSWGLFDTTSVPYLQSVSPTASVTGTSTNTSITQFMDRNGYYETASLRAASFNVTVTNIILGPNAPVCETGTAVDPVISIKTPCPTYTTHFTGSSSPTITTRFFAPLMISNPESCTRTSFSYTSSQQVDPLAAFPSGPLATEVTDRGVVMLVTTYIATLSTNLGGQAVTVSLCDIYLRPDAVEKVDPNYSQSSYMNQCVDPSSFLCATSNPASTDFGCGSMPITYPPGGHGVVATGESSSPTATSKSAAHGRTDCRSWAILVGIAALSNIWMVWWV